MENKIPQELPPEVTPNSSSPSSPVPLVQSVSAAACSIKIVDLEGKVGAVGMAVSDTVESMQNRIFRETGIPPENQQVIVLATAESGFHPTKLWIPRGKTRPASQHIHNAWVWWKSSTRWWVWNVELEIGFDWGEAFPGHESEWTAYTHPVTGMRWYSHLPSLYYLFETDIQIRSQKGRGSSTSHEP